jgi:hypothetical protein
MARKMRVSGAAMMRARRGVAHGGPGPALSALAWVCLGFGVEALDTGVEALSLGVEALGFGDEALSSGVEALSATVEALHSGVDALISDVGALISERQEFCAPASRP